MERLADLGTSYGRVGFEVQGQGVHWREVTIEIKAGSTESVTVKLEELKELVEGLE